MRAFKIKSNEDAQRDAKTAYEAARGGKLSISDIGTSSGSSLLDATRGRSRTTATLGSMSVADLQSRMIDTDPPELKV
jgi:hypothetical protein